MRIYPQKADLFLDRTDPSRLSDRGSVNSRGDSRFQQVGLDRIEMSRTGEMAAALVTQTMQSRQERVAGLASQFQAGTYTPNLTNLSNAILNEDTDPSEVYGG
jgi:hypothetical protein